MEPHVITLRGPVGSETFNVRLVQNLPPGPLRVVIDSGGGCITTGVALYQILREHPGGQVTIEIIHAGSAAVLPALAGDHRKIHGNGSMFLHGCWGAVVGRESDMRQAARAFHQQNALYAAICQERTGLTLRRVNALMRAESQLGAGEAVRLGFAHEVLGELPQCPSTPAGDLQLTALAALQHEARARKPQECHLRSEALPAAMVSHSTAQPVFTKRLPAIPTGRAAAMLAAFVEGERREGAIRQQLEVRLKRAIDLGGRVTWPVRASWACGQCGTEQFHPPAQDCWATPCRNCGATSSPSSTSSEEKS